MEASFNLSFSVFGKIEALYWRSISAHEGPRVSDGVFPYTVVSQHECSEVMEEASNRTGVAEEQAMYPHVYP